MSILVHESLDVCVGTAGDNFLGNSLLVQWLGCCASTARALGQGTKIPQTTQHGQMNKSIKVISLDRNCWVKVFNRFFIFIAMSLDLRDLLVLKKTTEESRHTCICICARVFCEYRVCFQFPLSSEHTAHTCVSILHLSWVVYQVLVPQVDTLLPSPSGSLRSVPSPTKWHQYSTTSPSPSTLPRLPFHCSLIVDYYVQWINVCFFFSNMYFDFYLRIASTVP